MNWGLTNKWSLHTSRQMQVGMQHTAFEPCFTRHSTTVKNANVQF